MRYYSLEIIRGLSALWVFFFHIYNSGNIDKTNFLVELLISQGWIGMDIFFVLSGMVITLSLKKLAIQTRSKKELAAEYFKRRFFRIAPLYYLTCFVFVIFISNKIEYYDILSHLLFIHNLFFDSHGSINGLSWSIGLEVQWYILSFVIVLLSSKYKTYQMVFFAIILSLLWQIFIFYIYYPVTQSDAQNTRHIIVLITQLPGVLTHFFIGMILPQIKEQTRFRLKILIPAILLLLLYIFFMVKTERAFHDGSVLAIWIFVFSRSFLAVIAGLLILSVSQFSVRGSVFKALSYLGKISYGIYLWHGIIIPITTKFFRGLPFVFSSVLATILISILSWHLFEKPCLNFAKSGRSS